MDKSHANHLFYSYLKPETVWKMEEMECSSYNQQMQENQWFEDYFSFFSPTFQLRVVIVFERDVFPKSQERALVFVQQFFLPSNCFLVFRNRFCRIQWKTHCFKCWFARRNERNPLASQINVLVLSESLMIRWVNLGFRLCYEGFSGEAGSFTGETQDA